MKYIALDIGNVICKVDLDVFLEKTSKTLNVRTEAAFYFLERVQRLQDLSIVKMSDELEYHFKIKSKIIIKELIDAWHKTVIPNPIMIAWTEKLIKNDVKVALLSNIGDEHGTLIKTLIPAIYNNSVPFFSNEVGARKPGLLFYKTFLDLNKDFYGCIYLDDRVENVEAGNRFGFRSNQFDLNDFKDDKDLTDKLNEIEALL
jgi:FMN phosphatase YigB (HAD superfamily)